MFQDSVQLCTIRFCMHYINFMMQFLNSPLNLNSFSSFLLVCFSEFSAYFMPFPSLIVQYLLYLHHLRLLPLPHRRYFFFFLGGGANIIAAFKFLFNSILLKIIGKSILHVTMNEKQITSIKNSTCNLI